MAVIEKNPKMKRLILLVLTMVAASAAVEGQSPTATPGTPFNPFQPPNRDYPTPGPTVSKEALSQVPSRTQDGKTNRNSSSTVTSTPTPEPNNRMMSSGNSPPIPGGGILFGNGAQLVRQGDRVIITYGGRRYQTSRKDAKPPPAYIMRYNCKYVKHWLDTHRVNDDWRWASIWWADHCL